MLYTNRLSFVVLLTAVPMLAASVPGIKNFDKVDTHVFRGAQPTDEGFQYLAKLGVKTIIDLREPGERGTHEERVVTAAGMKYVNIPMTGLTAPTEAETLRILAFLEDTAAGPVFVHCMRGADRTGAVIAAYHIEHDNWENARALRDAKAHSMSSFQLPRMSYIRNFRARTDVAKTTPAGDSAPASIAVAATPTAADATN